MSTTQTSEWAVHCFLMERRLMMTDAVGPASTATVQATSASPASSAGAGHLVGQGMGAVGGLVAALAML